MSKTFDSTKYESKNRLRRFFIQKFKNELLALIKLTNAKRVLDAGCGEGYLLSFLDSQIKDWELVGFDISGNLIDRAREKLPLANFMVSDIYNSGYLNKNFDLVLSTEVLEHLEDPERALNEIRRLSRKWVILSVPNEPLFSISSFLMGKDIKTFGNNPGHINRWSEGDFVKLVKDYFFVNKVVRVFPWLILLCKIRD